MNEDYGSNQPVYTPEALYELAKKNMHSLEVRMDRLRAQLDEMEIEHGTFMAMAHAYEAGLGGEGAREPARDDERDF